MRLVLVRHGETDWNRSRRLQGQTDIPLNERGQWQASRTAEVLSRRHQDLPFDRVYSSDLSRAWQTAQAFADLEKTPLHPAPDWRERAYGVLEGHDPESAAAALPEVAQAWRSRLPEHPIPGGESLLQFAGRVRTALDHLGQAHRGQRLLLFTHGGVLDIVYREIMGLPLDAPRQHSLVNAGINEVALSDQGWQLLLWGDDSHLQVSTDDVTVL